MVDRALPLPGDVIAGKYRIDKVAGEGGMGVVFAARHLSLDQPVAVKILMADAATSEDVVERFTREAQAAARINSLHVARVMDAGSLENGLPFLAMEYLEGCDLAELVELNGALQLEETADYIMQSLEALAHAHAVGIVHRDIKPSNLYLALQPDGSNIIKILDFGISKSTKARPGDKVLTGQAVLGSPAYMSPEQLRNASTLDKRADLWSLGVVMYELLTGVLPFDADGVGEIFAAILEKDALPLSVHIPHIPAEIEAIVARAMKRVPAERYQSAGSFAAALAPFASEKWRGVVEKIEQLENRATRLAAIETPFETRIIVAAAEAAAALVRQSNAPPGFPSSSRVAFVRNDRDAPTHARAGDHDRDDMPTTRLVMRPRRNWKFAIAGAACAVVAIGVAGVLGIRPSRGASPALATLQKAAIVTPSVTELPKTPVADDDLTVEAVTPVVSAAPAPVRPAVSSKKKTRPKFLRSPD